MPLSEFADWTNVELDLERGQRVLGRCVSSSGAPVPGVQVSSGTRMFTTDQDGRFELDGVAWSGAKLMVRSFTHVMPPPRRIPAALGEVDVGDIVLEDGQPVAGRVIDALGHIAANTGNDLESCATCHGTGKELAVEVVHKNFTR